MRLKLILGLLGCLLAVPVVARSQTPSAGTLENLLAEVRLLRQTLERQAALQARAQLVMVRLAVQDQRLAPGVGAIVRRSRARAGATGPVRPGSEQTGGCS